MLRRLLYFLSYHNALPLALGFLFLSVGAAMAASPEVRENFYNATETVVSVDNSYIRTVNLDTYTPKIQITSVEEDAAHYYVGYRLETINIEDHSWKDVNEERTLKVWKNNLGKRDLGLYVTSELSQVADWEMERLRKTQAIEKQNGISEEVVATVYSGLIGKFFDPKQEVLPGYIPVKNETTEDQVAINPPDPVVPPPEGAPSQGSTNVDGSTDSVSAAVDDNTGGSNTSSVVSTSGDTVPPSLTILGNNPARIPLNTVYVDLGVVVSDNVNSNIGVSYTVGGSVVSQVEINTAVVGEHSIVYSAVDQAGNRRTVERVVIVYNPNAVSNAESSSSATSSSEVTP